MATAWSWIRSALAAACAVAGISSAGAAEVALAPRAVVNQSGAIVESSGMRWLGTGANAALSRLGLIFTVPGPCFALRSAPPRLCSRPPGRFSGSSSMREDRLPSSSGDPHRLRPARTRCASGRSSADRGRRPLCREPPLERAQRLRDRRDGARAGGARALFEAPPVRIARSAAGEGGTPWGRKYFTTAPRAVTLKLTFEDPPAPPPMPVAGAPQPAAPATAGASAAR